jgi:nucleotide sugar dehydrogenase
MKYKVCIIGLGNIGLAVAKHIRKYYPKMVGYDISQKTIDRAQNLGINSFSALPLADTYVIAVGTWFGNGKPDMNAVANCCSKIALVNPCALVTIESTLSVGTARKFAELYNLKYVAVCPHRWWEEDEINHGVAQLRVIGALNERSMKKALGFYASIKVPLHKLSSLEHAEMIKIVENTDRYLKIAYAEQLKIVCDKNGLNFAEVREAANTKWNVEILEARDGIGKECLPKDIQYLRSLDPANILLNAAIQLDECYRHNLMVLCNTQIKAPKR